MSYSHLNPAAAPTDRDILTTLQRWLELSFDAPMIVLFGFFAYHQWANTGFLTPKFGPFEMLCLYGPIVVALVAPAVRAWSGRRDPARPWDVVMKLSLAAGSLWLLTVFPFDFSHLADILPGPIRFLISWITDDIGRIIMVVQVVLGLITAITTTARYVSPRR